MPDLEGPVVLDAQTLLSIPGTGSREFITETVHFYFTGIAQLTYTTEYDGWISGWQDSKNTGLGIAINVDCPTALISAQGVWKGFVYPPINTAVVVEQNVPPGGRWPFQVGDRINVRTYSAAIALANLFLSRFVT